MKKVLYILIRYHLIVVIVYDEKRGLGKMGNRDDLALKITLGVIGAGFLVCVGYSTAETYSKEYTKSKLMPASITYED